MSKKLTQITSSDEKPDFGERIYEQEGGKPSAIGAVTPESLSDSQNKRQGPKQGRLPDLSLSNRRFYSSMVNPSII